MLLASVMKGISPVLQHRAIHETYPTSALAASVVSFSLLLVILWPFAWRRMRTGARIKISHVRLAILFGVVAAIVTYSGWTAMGQTNPSYVVAIGRLSILFGMLWGIWFLREKVTKIRLGAGIIMLGGVILMAL
jgi:drug/metabolite transporter (DMT)-like permease